MITILVDSDYLPSADLATNVAAAQKALTEWGTSWGINVTLTSDPKAACDMVAHITNLHRHTGAYGYHTVEAGIQTYNTDGTHSIVAPKPNIPAGSIPTSYICPAALSNNIYGTYTAAHWSIALWNYLRTKITKASIQTSPARYKEGVVTVLVHELMEM